MEIQVAKEFQSHWLFMGKIIVTSGFCSGHRHLEVKKQSKARRWSFEMVE